MSDSSTEGIKIVLHPVSDLDAAKRVYAVLLGMQPQADSPYYVGFDAGGQHVGLVPKGGPQEMDSPAAFWRVSGIEEKIAEMLDAGAAIKEAPHEVGPGRVVATLTDPDGNVLGLVEDQ